MDNMPPNKLQTFVFDVWFVLNVIIMYHIVETLRKPCYSVIIFTLFSIAVVTSLNALFYTL